MAVRETSKRDEVTRILPMEVSDMAKSRTPREGTPARPRARNRAISPAPSDPDTPRVESESPRPAEPSPGLLDTARAAPAPAADGSVSGSGHTASHDQRVPADVALSHDD